MGWVGFVEDPSEALLKCLSQVFELELFLEVKKSTTERCRRNERKLQEWKHIGVIPPNLHPSKTTLNRWLKVYQAKAVTLGET